MSSTKKTKNEYGLTPTQEKHLKPFQSMGFEVSYISGTEAVGTCIYCDKPDKLYINLESGKFSCKSGSCLREGNTYSALRIYYDIFASEMSSKVCKRALKALAKDRGFTEQELKDAKLVFDTVNDRWLIPIFSGGDKIVTLQTHVFGSHRIFEFPGVNTGLGGVEHLRERPDEPVFLVEGKWDAIALELLLEEAEEEGVVIWAPGAGTFKEIWASFFQGRDLFICYDNDAAGATGTRRVITHVSEEVSSIHILNWHGDLEQGFDIRDFRNEGGKFAALQAMFTEEELDDKIVTGKEAVKDLPALSDSDRPLFKEIIQMYIDSGMKMNRELVDALKVIFAVVYSNQLDGEPLWIHLVSPPGSGKTELTMSTEKCESVRIMSSVTAKGLVSGFNMGSKDPSILPTLFGKTCVLKDFTEVLKMPPVEKDEVYSILRGAFDGEVMRKFGNGVTRFYKGKFSLITGVTQEIFRESADGSSLGERFLMYHIIKGVGHNVDDILRAAMNSSGNETGMKEKIKDAAASFLNFRVDFNPFINISKEYEDKLISLSQVVAMLRGSVSRDKFKEDRLNAYRGQYEVPTRIIKQLKKILASLAICNKNFTPSKEDYRLLCRIAIDSCKGFNFEIVQYISEHEWQNLDTIALALKVPKSSLDLQIKDMLHLEILIREQSSEKERTRGRPAYYYRLSDYALKQWVGAGLIKSQELTSKKPRLRARFKQRNRRSTTVKVS